jgi:hypothetical protein
VERDEDVKNVSSRCVWGYVLKIQFISVGGKPMTMHARLGLRRNTAGVLTCIEPGQVFHIPQTVAIPTDNSGNLGTYATTVDFVVFSDGSTWGPHALPDGNRLLGMIDASNKP